MNTSKTPSPWMILTTVMIGTFMGALDSSIVNVSIPSMMKAFNSGLSQIEWVITAYMIAFAVSMPLTNGLKNRWSGRWLYFLSLGLFTIGSILCGIADDLGVLVIARVIQAFGGGAMTPTAMAIIAETFPQEKRGRALGYWGLGVVLGPAIGPTLGGWLTEHWSWRWIFLINVPFGIIGMIMAVKYLADDRKSSTRHQRFDGWGFATLTFALISLLYGLSLFEKEILTATSFFCIVAALIAIWLFLRIEHRRTDPIVDLKLFKRPVFVSCLLVTMARSAALLGGVFLLPFLLQGQLGYTETQSGLIMLPGALVLAVLMPFAGYWSDTQGARFLTIIGLVFIFVSMVCFIFVDRQTPAWFILSALLVRGLGLGLLVTPVSAATVSAVPLGEVPMASSISSLTQQIAGSFGVALLCLLQQVLEGWYRRQGATAPDASLWAINGGFVAAAVLMALAIWPALRLPKALPGGSSAEPLHEA